MKPLFILMCAVALVALPGARASPCTTQPYTIIDGGSQVFVVLGDGVTIEQATGSINIVSRLEIVQGIWRVDLSCTSLSTGTCTGVITGC